MVVIATYIEPESETWAAHGFNGPRHIFRVTGRTLKAVASDAVTATTEAYPQEAYRFLHLGLLADTSVEHVRDCISGAA